MTNLRIATARQLPPAMMQGLAQLGEVVVAGADTAAMEGCQIYVAVATDPIPASLIESMPQTMGLIGNLGVGTDNVDLKAASARGLQVSNTPVVTEDTADLAFALMLATARRLSYCESMLRADKWAEGAQVQSTRVHGKVLGIVGLGAIGQAVARRATGFGMKVLYNARSRKLAAEEELGVQHSGSLADLLARSDIVSLHCPLTEQTRHIINDDTLSLMKPGAILINTGRGPLIDEQALIDTLASGHLGGAGLDVFEFEPRVSPGLLAFDNVTLLPHIGSATGECRMDMAMRLLTNIKHFAEHGQPQDRIV
ncbi:MAG: 2-hydroxyacid dehydrogenase [Parahaliea sp.]